MRESNLAHASRPWRIHELTQDFRLEDVWALPTPGDQDDFPRLVQNFPQMLQGVSAGKGSGVLSRATKVLFAIRWKLGEWFGWDRPDAGTGTPALTLRDRLPADLLDTPPGPGLHRFSSVYLLDNEWAAEIFNRTVQAVLHLSWVPDGGRGYRGQMAVYVKPHGVFGALYMAAIRPFRRLIVYPALMRNIERGWRRKALRI